MNMDNLTPLERLREAHQGMFTAYLDLDSRGDKRAFLLLDSALAAVFEAIQLLNKQV